MNKKKIQYDYITKFYWKDLGIWAILKLSLHSSIYLTWI